MRLPSGPAALQINTGDCPSSAAVTAEGSKHRNSKSSRGMQKENRCHQALGPTVGTPNQIVHPKVRMPLHSAVWRTAWPSARVKSVTFRQRVRIRLGSGVQRLP
ncbi:hypothetical protein G6F24_017905 [Rhizopus arrhizus]|nr:hypothetical protein G6F24_017905 [Rhizopus arrhizus]